MLITIKYYLKGKNVFLLSPPMKISCLFLVAFAFVSFSCKRTLDAVVNHGLNAPNAASDINYLIRQGQHYADQNGFQTVSYTQQSLTVKFDSSAVYQTTDAVNQEDINKLYGFSDNNSEHQQYSARFGWNWARDSLRLYAYVYNNGERVSAEIGPVAVGADHHCSISVAGSTYIFTVDDMTVRVPRASTTPEGSGYRLYPYFGGDETAPHDIHINIHEQE
jgi:hypothetical protein